jgi:hypothetical protein
MENKDLRYQRLSRPDEMMLPVEEAQLREVLRLGLGRAILEAHRNDLRQFRDAILDACLHCYAVDAQSTRSPRFVHARFRRLSPR